MMETLLEQLYQTVEYLENKMKMDKSSKAYSFGSNNNKY